MADLSLSTSSKPEKTWGKRRVASSRSISGTFQNHSANKQFRVGQLRIGKVGENPRKKLNFHGTHTNYNIHSSTAYVSNSIKEDCLEQLHKFQKNLKNLFFSQPIYLSLPPQCVLVHV
jgi:hypothetical protein